MPEAPPRDHLGRSVAGYFGAVSIRNDETSVSTRLEVRDDLRDASGALRTGAATFAVDMATGLAMGLAVLDRDLWVVTTDLDVHLTAPVTAGPLRVDVDVLRAGATTAVSAFSLHDEGEGRTVGGGTATGRPFPFEFDRSFVDVPVGRPLRYDDGITVPRGPLVSQLGFGVGEDGSVTVGIADWLRNPWGILHGGVTACLVDVAAEVAGSTTLGRPVRVTSELVRYLAPGRVGPVRAVPSVLAVGDGRALAEVRVRDEGADGRLIAIGTSTLT